MKIKFTKCGAAIGFGYHEGEEADLVDKTAKLIIKKGYAELLDEFEGNLPADMPAREILAEAGITTVEEVAKIADLTELKGVGKKTAELIEKYLLSLE